MKNKKITAALICAALLLTGYVPAGRYVRLRTENTSGTPTFNYRSGQEVQL